MVDQRKPGLSVMCLNSWVYGDAISEIGDSGEGTVCKFITFQMNYSATFNLLMLENSCIALSIL